jgi:hypothetical protein
MTEGYWCLFEIGQFLLYVNFYGTAMARRYTEICHQRPAVAALLGGEAGELCLQVGVPTRFHGSRLWIAENRTNNPNDTQADTE